MLQHDGSPDRDVHRANLTSPRLAGNVRFERVLDNLDVIELGDTGDEVRRIQQMLMDLGFSLPTHGTSGTFSRETRLAVEAFRRSKGLVEDGRVGFRTIDALDRAFAAFTLPANRTAPWTLDCVLKILCPWSRHMVENLLPTYTIVTFDSRALPTETWDGTKWVADTFRSGGYLKPATREIGLLNTTSCQRFALAAYHEGWHAMQATSLVTTEAREIDAYVSAEQWSTDVSVPGQQFEDTGTGAIRGLRRADPAEGEVVDPTAAPALVRRKYGGVTSVPGETVTARVGASDVRVRRSDGTLYVRPAQVGDRVRGPIPTMTHVTTMNPADWDCTGVP